MQVDNGIATFCFTRLPSDDPGEARSECIEIRCKKEGNKWIYYRRGDYLLETDEPTYCEVVKIDGHYVVFVPVGNVWQGKTFISGMYMDITLSRLPLGCGRYMLANERGKIRHVDDELVRTYPEYLTVRFEGDNQMTGLLPTGTLVKHRF